MGEQRQRLEAKQAAVTEAQQRLDGLATQLQQLEQSAANAKRAAESVGERISDAAPLRELRGALQVLRAETQQLLLREAMVRQQSFRNARAVGGSQAFGLDSQKPY